ncbi:MAG: LysR family transcriptional regulator [Pseudomonadota bacterium]
MELRQVRYFLALSETLNFTRAAELCNVTQPTLTLSIKKLEDELGGPMIQRERGNTHLTQLGEMLLPFLKQVFESSTAATELAREIAEGRRVPLNFGISDVVPKAVLIEPLRCTAQSSEGLELHVEGGSDRDLVSKLIGGGLHLSLVDQAATDPDQLRFHPVYRESFLILMPETDPLAEGNAVDLEALAMRPWIELVGSEAHKTVADRLRQEDPEWVPRHRATRSIEAQVLTQAGMGFTLVGAKEPILSGLVTRDMAEAAPERVVGLAEARGRPMSSTVQAFGRQLRAISYA